MPISQPYHACIEVDSLEDLTSEFVRTKIQETRLMKCNHAVCNNMENLSSMFCKYGYRCYCVCVRVCVCVCVLAYFSGTKSRVLETEDAKQRPVSKHDWSFMPSSSLSSLLFVYPPSSLYNLPPSHCYSHSPFHSYLVSHLSILSSLLHVYAVLGARIHVWHDDKDGSHGNHAHSLCKADQHRQVGLFVRRCQRSGQKQHW